MEHVDVIVVGAGLSGIGGACHLTMESPGKTFVHRLLAPSHRFRATIIPSRTVRQTFLTRGSDWTKRLKAMMA